MPYIGPEITTLSKHPIYTWLFPPSTGDFQKKKCPIKGFGIKGRASWWGRLNPPIQEKKRTGPFGFKLISHLDVKIYNKKKEYHEK